jgi:hypothetical protein
MVHKKPQETKTTFFGSITPTSVQTDWQPLDPTAARGDEGPIPDQYHPACIQLAAWFGSNGGGRDWADESSGASFFRTRFHLLRSAIGWASYDWAKDTALIATRDEAKKAAQQQATAITKLIRAMKMSQGPLPLKPGAQAALDAAIAELRHECARFDALAQAGFACHRGPIFYPTRPSSFCSNVIAVAVYLADVAVRVSKGQNPDLENRRRPDLNGKVPWEAVRLFAAASAQSSNDVPASNGIQQRIKAAVDGDIRLRGWWSPYL